MVRTGLGLKRWREKQGLSQEALARRLGVSSNTVARWERGVIRKLPLFLASKLREVKP